MGIKNWFGGDKKKEAFREEAQGGRSRARSRRGKVEEAHQGGQAPRDRESGDDKTQLRRDVSQQGRRRAVRAQGHLFVEGNRGAAARSRSSWRCATTRSSATKWDLAKLRTLTEIRGQAPARCLANSAALRGVQLRAGRDRALRGPGGSARPASMGGQAGVPVKWEHVLRDQFGQGPLHPGRRQQGDWAKAILFITNKRLFSKVSRAAAVEYSPKANFFLYRDGIRLERNVGNTLLKYKSRSDETAWKPSASFSRHSCVEDEMGIKDSIKGWFRGRQERGGLPREGEGSGLRRQASDAKDLKEIEEVR